MKKTLLSLLLLGAALASYAAIERQPVQNQLSNSTVNALTFAPDGHLWIGTVRGLNRYNGTNFKVYSQHARLTDDNISSLCPDTEGRIWIGTGSGIAMLQDGQIDTTVRVPAGRIFRMVSLDKNQLLFSTRGRLQLMDKETHECRTIFQDTRIAYNSFQRTTGGYIWINHLTRPNITVLDPSYRITREISLPGVEIRQTFCENDGTVYVCTSNGLLHFSGSGSPLPVPQTLSRLCDKRNVIFMTHPYESEDWILGIEGSGFFQIAEGEEPRHIFNQDHLDGVHNCRVAVSPDNLWISRNYQGLDNKYLPEQQIYIPVPNRYPQEALNKMYILGEKELMVATNKALYLYNQERREVLPLPAQEINGNGLIGETMLDRRGQLWMVYSVNELRCYRKENDRMVITFRCPVQGGACMWDDADGTVHLLQPDGILNVDPQQHISHTHIEEIPTFWYSDQIYTGEPYFMTNSGIWFLKGNHFEQLEIPIHDPSAFYVSADGDYWIGTRHNGLFRYSPSTREFRPYPYGNAQADPDIMSIAGTPDGHIWICCRTEVSRISPSCENTINYQAALNLNGSFASNNNAILPDGTAFFGNIYQIISFREMPEEKAIHNIPLSLEGLIINGVNLMENLPETLVLSHNQNQLSFYFSGLNFNPALHPVYQYRLEGYDREWLSADDNLRAGYSGLFPGRYTFRVRVQQPGGTWSPEELVQVIRIKPSPLLSAPMLVLYALLVLGAIFFVLQQFVRLKMNRERLALSEQESLLAQQMSQERTTFFTNVSHEFRTPLALIWGPVRELSASGTLGEKEKKMISIVERNAQRMIRLTDQLLQYNQAAANRDMRSVRQIDLARLLRKMLENFEYMFRDKNLSVQMDIPSELAAYCDREKVEKIVFNLLSNAIKYTPEHGQIKLSLHQAEGNVVIEVADTGIGIAPDKLERIFDRYERLGEKVDNTLPTGFGIGLNYARHLAQLHKGELSARTNDPLGTIFTFSFPAGKEAYASDIIWEEEENGNQQPVAENGETFDEASVNILVVEDNPDMQDYIRSFLSPKYKVAVAGDGEEAWKVIRISAPDLIVSDVMMPYKDGYTLCKELKNDAEYCHLPIILLTAKADMENQIHGLKLGADAYIAKPFDPQLFTTTVQNLLTNRQRMQHILSESPEAIAEAPLNAHDKAFLEKLNALIQEHLSEEDFNVTTLSLELGMSRTSLFSKTKVLLGQSPQSYLLNCRLKKAKELLKEGELNISEVAYRVGFATLTGFSRSFKNKFGIPPSEI